MFVSSADLAIVHDIRETVSRVRAVDEGLGGLADGEEVGSETADEPFDEDLEDCGCDEGVEEADYGVVEVPEGADADLHYEEDCDGDEGGEEGGGPDGDDFWAGGVGELGVDLGDEC